MEKPLERYVKIKLIGKGFYSKVYLVKDKKTGLVK